MENWKYSPDQLKAQVPDEILKVVAPVWENVLNFSKDTREQTLRQLMPNLSDKEVRESLKKNEKKLTPKFDALLILSKDIESVVKSSTIAWKNIYGLHKPSDNVVQIDDKDGEYDDMEEDAEIKDDEIENVDIDDADEEEEQEATGGSLSEIQNIEDTDVEKIAVEIMTSLPHSLRKSLLKSSSEKVSTELVEVKTRSPSTQPMFGVTLMSV